MSQAGSEMDVIVISFHEATQKQKPQQNTEVK